MHIWKSATFGGLLAISTLGLAATAPSQAAPLSPGIATGTVSVSQGWTGNSAGIIEKAQFRRRSGARSGRRAFGGRSLRRGRVMRHGRGYGYRRGYRYRHGYRGRRGYYRRGINPGAAVAAGIFGAAVAAAIASSGLSTAQYHAACDRKYKTYDPSTGTYRGYDGERHPCRL